MIITSFVSWVHFKLYTLKHTPEIDIWLTHLFFDYVEGKITVETMQEDASREIDRAQAWGHHLFKAVSWAPGADDTQDITTHKKALQKKILAFLERTLVTKGTDDQPVIAGEKFATQAKQRQRCIDLVTQNNNLYDLIYRVDEDGELKHQLYFLITHLNNTYPVNHSIDFAGLGLAFASTLIGLYAANQLFAALAWFQVGFPQGIIWLVLTLSAKQTVPFLGIAFHGGLLLMKWYYAIMRGEAKHFDNKEWYLFAETLRIGLILAGHVLTYVFMGVASMNLPIAFVFIAAVIVELAFAIYEYQTEYQVLVAETAIATWTPAQKMEYYRIKNNNDRLDTEKWIHLLVILGLVGCVICWNLLPPSLVLSLACVLFIVFIIGLKELAHEHNRTYYAHQLHNDIRHVTMPGETFMLDDNRSISDDGAENTQQAFKFFSTYTSNDLPLSTEMDNLLTQAGNPRSASM